jgi:hypothetical protein
MPPTRAARADRPRRAVSRVQCFQLVWIDASGSFRLALSPIVVAGTQHRLCSRRARYATSSYGLTRRVSR